jgi:hypothetical protein
VSHKKSGKPTSQARIDANRANALKSTGPKSPEGKARSRMNAWKHGITAEHVLVSAEPAEDFEALALDYRSRLQPADGYELRLVDQLISIHWHIIRMRFIQSLHLQMELERLDLDGLGLNPEIPTHYKVPLAYKALGESGRIIELTNRELSRLSREYARINQVFLDMRRECPVPSAPAPYEAGSPASPQSPVQNEPNPAPAAAAGPSISLRAKFFTRKPEPAEPGPPLVFAAAA